MKNFLSCHREIQDKLYYCYFLLQLFSQRAHTYDRGTALHVWHKRSGRVALLFLSSSRAVSVPVPQFPCFEMEQIVPWGTETTAWKCIRNGRVWWNGGQRIASLHLRENFPFQVIVGIKLCNVIRRENLTLLKSLCRISEWWAKFLFGDRAGGRGCIAASLWHGREQTAEVVEKADLKPKLVPGVAKEGLIWWKIPPNNESGCAWRSVSSWKSIGYLAGCRRMIKQDYLEL